MAGWSDRDRVIAVAKTENILIYFKIVFAACKDEHVAHSFGFTQFDTHSGDFIVPLMAALFEDADKVGLVRVLSMCRVGPIKCLLAL